MHAVFQRLGGLQLFGLARRFLAVAILIARQVGKTTLPRTLFGGLRYLELEDPRTAHRLRRDPRFS